MIAGTSGRFSTASTRDHEFGPEPEVVGLPVVATRLLWLGLPELVGLWGSW
jgi:hypothetical protein